MNQDLSESAEPVVAVARAVRTRGLKGEILAELLTDFPDRFADLSQLIAIAPDGKRSVVELESYWFHQTRVILKLAGYDSIETASGFVGCEFAVPESRRVQLSEGQFYDWELVECVVETMSGKLVGYVRNVMRVGGGVEMLVVESDDRHEHLIPMVQSIVVNIDTARKSIRIDPPHGLLEL
ncbi:MAG: ribosome maturation factor RimM [Acidobacteriota bacterium]|nr:ribosome maturation factor RimM [Acidobacteriota bacterium]